MSDRLRFGIFMAPFHPAGENPTLALERDLELIEHLDRLGYDEAWIGEHHSAGTEIIASPEIFIAAAAERTRHIKLGTGVISVSYHNPLWVAERAVLLDHLTRGRFMLGLGPGSLPTDAAMIGLDQSQTRELLDGGRRHHHAVAPQRRAGHVQERPLGPARRPPPPPPVLQPAVRRRRAPRSHRRRARSSPAGTAIGLLSIGATQAGGLRRSSALHWDVMEERAAKFGRRSTATQWRLVGLMHIAETREQAYKDVEYGIEQWFHYFQSVAAFPQMAVGGDEHPRDDRLRQRERPRLDRYGRRRGGADRTADQAVQRWLRLLHAARPRMGQPGRDPSQLSS